MKRLAVHPLAEAEINDAFDYYESCAERLGSDFIDELEKAFEAIIATPSTWASASPGKCQRYMLSRFPFSVIYMDGEKTVEILALQHSRRRPRYWVSRLKALPKRRA